MQRRIVFFHLLNNFTGSPLVLKNVIVLAVSEGYEVVLYTSKSEGFLTGIPGVTFRNNFYIRSRFRLLTLFTFFLSQFLVAIRVLIEESNKNGLFYINTVLPFSGVLIGKVLKRSVIQHIHEFSVSPSILNAFLFWVVRNFASIILVVSKALAQNKFLEGRDTTLVYNSASQEFEEVKSQECNSIIQFNVTMLASLRPYKGIAEFVKLALDLPEFLFTLVVSDDASDVERYFTNTTLPPNLTILPVQRNVHAIYRNASLILNLTHTDQCLETFGLTLLEGMHYGLPVIGPSRGGVSELIEEGVNGYRIDYFHYDKLVGTIRSIGRDQEKYQQLREGACLIRKNFSRDKFNAKIKKLLNDEYVL